MKSELKYDVSSNRMVKHGCECTKCFTQEKVEHDFLSCSAVALVQTVCGTKQPRDTMTRHLQEFHQGAHAAPRGVLAGADSEPLGQPQVDGEQGAERHANKGGVEPHAALLRRPLAAR